MRKRRIGHRKLPLMAAVLLLCLLAACGGGTPSGNAGGSGPGSGSGPGPEPEETSVLSIPGDTASGKLAEDMKAGRIPDKCSVLYDTMGARPDVTLTDPEQIGEIYRLLAQVRVTGGEAMEVTDSYHHVIFYLRDGTGASYNFLGQGVLEKGGKTYAVSGDGPLWARVREIQEEYMSSRQT